MADATIRIKLAELELDYQGDAAFLEKNLLDTVKKLLELQKQHPIRPKSSHSESGAAAPARVRPPGTIDHSTDTIANKLDAKTGPDLVIAAAAHLHFAQHKTKFTRKDLTSEMRNAPGHYKSSFNNNMNGYLSTLKSKDRLRLVGTDRYSLSNKEAQALEAKLAED